MILFAIGMVVGACVGVILMGLLVAGRTDPDAALYLRRLQHTCNARCRPIAERHFDDQGRPIW